MSRIYKELATEIEIDRARAFSLLDNAAPQIAAAEILEQRLREAGITAAARGHLDNDECIALVFAQGQAHDVERILDSHAVPLTAVDRIDRGDLLVHTYAATVMGQEIALAVCAPTQSKPS